MKKVLHFDWSLERNPELLLKRDLPKVIQAKQAGHYLKVTLNVPLGIAFSLHHPPIVFCGHTNNPFAFDEVNYSFEDAKSS